MEVLVFVSNKAHIDLEAHAGIKYVKATIQLGQAIEELKLEDSRLDDKTILLKAHLQNVKNVFT